MSRDFDAEARDEITAAKRVGELIGGLDEPLCSFCQSDIHVKPGCPIESLQKAQEAMRRKLQDDFDRRTYGYRRRR